MDDYRQIINDARPGQIVPIVKQIDIDEPVDFFARLSDYGRAENCQRMLEALQRSLELAEVIWADGLAETESIRIPNARKARKVRWPRYAAVAAGILLVLTTSIIWRALVRPAKKEISFSEIERKITESGSAARLLAAAELLAEYPDAQSIIKEQYRYIVETYPETSAAAKAKLKIQ